MAEPPTNNSEFALLRQVVFRFKKRTLVVRPCWSLEESFRTSSIVFLLLFVSLLIFSCATVASGQERIKRVLLLHSEANLIPANVAFDEGITTTMNAALGNDIYYFNEFLDTLSFSGNEYQLRMKDYLRQKYAQQQLDLIIATGPSAATFLEKNRQDVFGGTPVVFCALSIESVKKLQLGPKTTGVAMVFDSAGTLELALRLQPETRRILVISGASRVDEMVLNGAQDGLREVAKRLKVTYLTGLSLADLQKELGHLPSDTIVLYSSIFQDGARMTLSPEKALETVVSYSSVPVYGFVNTMIGRGIVGGRLTNLEAHTAKAAGLGLRILNGESADNIPVIKDETEPFTVDWRQLRRWNLDESRLPAGTVVKFKESSVWELYKWHIIGMSVLFALEGLLIATLLVQRKALRSSQALSSSALASFSGLLVVLDREGIVIDKTDRWLETTENVKPLAELRVGESYVEFCRNAQNGSRQISEKIVAGVLSVLKSDRLSFSLEYETEDGSAVRSFEMTVQRLLRPQGGAVISHTDVTNRKLAEVELQRQREELTHFARVAAMGELTASIAHELNQPLTAIMSNTQAAQRFLQSKEPDLDELKSILADVIADDRRAGEVIRRLRALLKRGELEMMPHDPNVLISEVIKMLHSDAIIKGIHIGLDLEPGLPAVWGDRVQLQQVILNLMINAIDAVSDNPKNRRKVIVRTHLPDGRHVQVEIRDSGVGISEDRIERIFEAFHTTKRDGMGMGLSICQTIIEHHRGRLWASNNPEGGATFFLLVPTSREVTP